MKLYIVMYGTKLSAYTNLSKSALYIGECEADAERIYKNTLRWNSNYHIMEINYDEHDYKEHTADNDLQKDEVAYKASKVIENVLYDSSMNIARRMVKNGKVSISIENYHGITDEPENEFSKTIKDIYRALKFKLDKTVSDNNITVPIRIKYNKTDFLVYNQK